MSNITIGRYGKAEIVNPDGTREPLTNLWAGWIESDEWIIFLDAEGRPAVFWSQREASGGVIGEGMVLNAAA